MVEIDPADCTWDESYRIMTSVVVPRPIGWISTVDERGHDNLAPYSHYNNVCAGPPVVMFSSGRLVDGSMKDSSRNAIDVGEFAVNVVTESVARSMDESSAYLPREESEFDFADIERADCERISPPRVADAAVCLECSLFDYHEVYNNVMVLGEVEYVHVDDRLLTDGRIDARKVDAVGRLGGPYYTDAERIDLERNHYDTPNFFDDDTELGE